MKDLVAFIKKHSAALVSQGQQWIADRELDQKRLDWLDADFARVEEVAKRNRIEAGDLRSAIDFFMAREVKTGSERPDK